jgi:hypothetical protein
MNPADFSPCGRYRYHLFRRLSDSPRQVAFVLLNPSTANGETDDPTIRRCMGFARRWGFGELRVVNIFAFRATRPGDMKREADPVGPQNQEWIAGAGREAELIVCGWGNHGGHLGQGRTAWDSLRAVGANPQALVVTRHGHPKHPLYVAYGTAPIPFTGARHVSPVRCGALEVEQQHGVAVVNETLAKRYFAGAALGRSVRLSARASCGQGAPWVSSRWVALRHE